jgi:AsmA protein
VNADLGVTGDASITDTLRIDGFSGEMPFENARAVFTLNELNAYRGAGAGEFVLNARNGLSTAIRFQGNAVDLSPLMSDMLDVNSIEGRANVNLDLLGVGRAWIWTVFCDQVTQHLVRPCLTIYLPRPP